MFCPHCGARNEPDASFCERCGRELDEASPTMAQDARPEPRWRDRRVLAASTVVVVLACAAAAVLLGGDDDTGGHAARMPTATVAPESSSTSTAPTPAQEPPTATEPQPATAPPVRRAVTATVARTCGRNGVGGDCHLSVRADPSSDAAELDRLDEGDALRLSCQVHGAPVHSSVLGTSSTVWSRTTHGGYVSNVYVVGGRLKATRLTLRRC